MLPFATEFPVRSITHSSEFLAEVLAWLRGNTYSTVLNDTSEKEIDGENAQLLAETGEHLQLRELKSDGTWKATGFRHDLPDNLGRLWRTEGVLTHHADSDDQNILRIRTQCIANKSGALLQIPKKPYLIKSLLKAGWGGVDGRFDITDRPSYLKNDDAGMETAAAIISGQSSFSLPVVYVSSISDSEWGLNPKEISSLAYQLGGIAHVVMEPDRRFSFQLKEFSSGANPYGGSVGIALPKHGLMFRRMSNKSKENSQEFLQAIVTTVTNIRSQMPSTGWDWTELQEKSLRNFRTTYKGALTAQEADNLLEDYIKQLSDVQDENRILKMQLSGESLSKNFTDDLFSTDELFHQIGAELYQGEILDRLRLAASIALERADASGLDERSRAIFQRIKERICRSPELDLLLSDLSKATKDPKKSCRELTKLLSRHGYFSKSDNKHVRLEPLEEYFGLSSITLPKTPSEYRGLRNLENQIKKILGIGSLP